MAQAFVRGTKYSSDIDISGHGLSDSPLQLWLCFTWRGLHFRCLTLWPQARPMFSLSVALPCDCHTFLSFAEGHKIENTGL